MGRAERAFVQIETHRDQCGPRIGDAIGDLLLGLILEPILRLLGHQRVEARGLGRGRLVNAGKADVARDRRGRGLPQAAGGGGLGRHGLRRDNLHALKRIAAQLLDRAGGLARAIREAGAQAGDLVGARRGVGIDDPARCALGLQPALLRLHQGLAAGLGDTPRFAREGGAQLTFQRGELWIGAHGACERIAAIIAGIERGGGLGDGIGGRGVARDRARPATDKGERTRRHRQSRRQMHGFLRLFRVCHRRRATSPVCASWARCLRVTGG